MRMFKRIIVFILILIEIEFIVIRVETTYPFACEAKFQLNTISKVIIKYLQLMK